MLFYRPRDRRLDDERAGVYEQMDRWQDRQGRRGEDVYSPTHQLTCSLYGVTSWNASYKDINLMVGDPPIPPWLVHAPKLREELTACTSVSLCSLRRLTKSRNDRLRSVFRQSPGFERWTVISSVLSSRLLTIDGQCTDGASSRVNWIHQKSIIS